NLVSLLKQFFLFAFEYSVNDMLFNINFFLYSFSPHSHFKNFFFIFYYRFLNMPNMVFVLIASITCKLFLAQTYMCGLFIMFKTFDFILSLFEYFNFFSVSCYLWVLMDLLAYR